MRRWRVIVLALAGLAGVSSAGCQSTQDKARAVQAAAAQQIAAEQGVSVSKENKDVKVVGTTLLHDQYGDAVVVELRNESKQPQINLPIVLDLRDAKGKSVYRNDIPGLESSLAHVPLIEPGQTIDWVNDQLSPTGTAKSVKVKVGESSETAPAKLPEIGVGPARIQDDPSGILARGSITNKSQVDQTKLVLFAVARTGGRVVAAGRGQFKNLKAGGGASTYSIFFIGDPHGADVTVTAPPSVLQ